MKNNLKVAVVGATGMVGQELVNVLLERRFPFTEIKLLASARSANFEIAVGEEKYLVEELTTRSFKGVDFVFFSAGEEISRQFAPEAVKNGAVVIDNSNAFRMDEHVPLVVPEVNPNDVLKHQGIIANPNCSTIQMVVALQPIHQAAVLKRVVVASYQAVSGAGREAVDELEEQCRAYLSGEEIVAGRIPYQDARKHYQLAFNLVPQIDIFSEDGYCREELKMIHETRKIMGLSRLAITATTVRVPVINCHSLAVNVELRKPITANEARSIFTKTPGIAVVDQPDKLEYPMPLLAGGKDSVFVGRIRPDHSVEHGLNLWIVADNIRKGAATNSVQIAELLIA